MSVTNRLEMMVDLLDEGMTMCQPCVGLSRIFKKKFGENNSNSQKLPEYMVAFSKNELQEPTLGLENAANISLDTSFACPCLWHGGLMFSVIRFSPNNMFESGEDNVLPY